ncbi:MAG: hypothetical protein V4857_13510 [Pseudomonadota bacterium]
MRHILGAFAGKLLLAMLLAPVPAVAAEPPTEPQLSIEAGMHTAMVRRVSTDAAGRFAVTASDDKTARVWDVADGRLLQVLRPPIGPGHEGKLFAVALTPDGASVAVAGWTGWDWNGKNQVYLFDRASGKLRKRLRDVPNVINHLAFSPDGRYLLASLGAQGVQIWDWRADAAPFSDPAYGGESYGAAWGVDGRLAVSSFDGKLRLYQVGEGGLRKLRELVAPGGKQPYGLAFSPDGRALAVGYNDSWRVDVLDAKDLSLTFSPDVQGVNNGNLGRVAWSADGQTLAAAGTWQVGQRSAVRRWPQAGRGAAASSITSRSTVLSLQTLHGGGWLLGAADPSWGVLGDNGQWREGRAPPVADLRGGQGEGFLLAAGGRQVQFGFEAFGKPPHRFDLLGRTLAPGLVAAGVPPRITGVNVSDWLHSSAAKLNGQIIKLREGEIVRSLAIAPDASSFVLGTEWALNLYAADGTARWSQTAPDVAWGVNIAPGGKLLVAAYGDGTMRWHRVSDGKELLAFFPHADRKRWVLWTPTGYYDASPGGEDLIGWQVNRGQDSAADFFPVSQFRERFHRPDIIDRVLDTMDETIAVAQANAVNGRRVQVPQSVAQVLPPVAEVTSGMEMRSSAREVRIQVRGRSAADAPVTGWRVRVNGQSVPDVRGLARQDSGGERELTVPIPAQDSAIEVFAENRHGVSVPVTVRVAWSGAKSGSFQIQPKLYVLAVGVGQYQHKDIGALALSAKDARDFAAALGKQKGGLYREVEVKLLTDAEATTDAVVDGLEWLQRSVTQHDMGMVFIAGHGVNDPTQGYTFLPVNADPARLRRTGVAMDEFKKTLSGLPGKAVFFLDTCHSGNVLGAGRRAGSDDVSGVINELSSAENGVVVFSSSTGRQFSLEDAAWGNGAFTKALVEGLGGAADYQKQGRITHKMLDLYVSERVKQLTGGRQSPVTQAPGGVPDFPLAVVK